jgi:cytochrome c-type biogenesis protein CcmE
MWCPCASDGGILRHEMDPSRKRRIRLTVALSTAVLLAAGLMWTSFSAGSEARTPKQLASATPGESYQLTGKVAKGSIRDIAGGKTFRVQERTGAETVPVRYVGAIPDTFREGREVIINVRKDAASGTFVGEKDSLVTKCPSKFEEKQTAT